MTTLAASYWEAAQSYRAAKTEEDKHNARVALLGFALNGGPIGRRAEKILRADGLGIIRTATVCRKQAR